MKKFSVVLLVCSTLLFSACSTDKKAESTDSTSKQEMKASKKKETTKSTTKSSTTKDSLSTSESVATETSNSQSTTEPVAPPVVQEETYDQMKQRTLKSTPADRTNWANKEWEAFGMALSENGLAMDDAGNIITQAQKEQLEAEKQQADSQSQVVHSAEQAVQIAQSQFGDNGGAWTWGSMGEVDDGYFVKAVDPNDGTMTHTAKSVIVHYDGSVTEN